MRTLHNNKFHINITADYEVQNHFVSHYSFLFRIVENNSHCKKDNVKIINFYEKLLNRCGILLPYLYHRAFSN